jgi:YVTN family beta-propeller protein
MNNKNLFYLFVAALCLMTSCNKDDDDNNNNSIFQGGAFVLNEGQFQQGNGSVSFYNPENETVENNIFENINDFPLGDVVQSMTIFDNKAYIVVNNSSKIEIVNLNTFEYLGTISNLTSPRYILPVSATKAYVTDLFSNTISVINLSSNSISSTIAVNGNTEELALASGKVFVTNRSEDYVYVINPNTDNIEDSIELAAGPSSIQIDNNGKVWVLCSGKTLFDEDFNVIGQEAGGLYKINASNLNVETALDFSTNDSPSRLRINAGGNQLYFLNNGIFAMSTTSSSLPSNVLIPSNGRSLYALNIAPNGDIYTADAIDFQQSGLVYRYSSDATLIDEFTTDIAPNGVYFFE